MFTVALFMGLIIGFIFGWLFAPARVETDAESEPEASAVEKAVDQTSLTTTTQVIELENQANEELPTDELPTDELPTDEPASTIYENTMTGKAIYESDCEAETPKSYNGITEGDTIPGTLTYYDVCYKCCGKLDGVTASGVTIYNGMDNPYIVSLNWLPLGSVISIDGVEYTVADRGGSGLDTVGRADIFTPAGHDAALQLGRTEAEITIVEIGE